MSYRSLSSQDFHNGGKQVKINRNEPTGLSHSKWITIVCLTHDGGIIRQYCNSKNCPSLEISMYIN